MSLRKSWRWSAPARNRQWQAAGFPRPRWRAERIADLAVPRAIARLASMTSDGNLLARPARPAADPPQRMWSQYFLGCYFLNYWRGSKAERPRRAQNEPTHQRVGAPGPSGPHHTHQVRWLTSLRSAPHRARSNRLGQGPAQADLGPAHRLLPRETIRPDVGGHSCPRVLDAHYVKVQPARRKTPLPLLVECSPSDRVGGH